jgi:hypothetical protein
MRRTTILPDRYVVFMSCATKVCHDVHSASRNQLKVYQSNDRVCGLVVTVPAYRSRGRGLDTRHYQIFWDVVVLERGPLILVRTYWNKKIALSIEETDINGRKYLLRWPHDNLYPQKTLIRQMRWSLSRYISFADWKSRRFLVFALFEVIGCFICRHSISLNNGNITHRIFLFR